MGWGMGSFGVIDGFGYEGADEDEMWSAKDGCRYKYQELYTVI